MAGATLVFRSVARSVSVPGRDAMAPGGVREVPALLGRWVGAGGAGGAEGRLK